MTLTWLHGCLAICRLGPEEPVPPWAWSGPIVSITRTAEELSIVCDERSVPEGVRAERDWRALQVAGPMDLGIVGVLASLTAPLAQAGISLFAVSTFDTDYLLVGSNLARRAGEVLRNAGHEIKNDPGDSGK